MIMRTSRILLTLVLLMTGIMIASADETVTVSSTNADIAENLDLKAVATLFGEVNNLEEFEKELNSEERHLNNLDLNGDGLVDYLRVVEIGEGENRLIVLQAVLAKDIYQDVASIYVERQADQTVSVQVIGDEYVYGTDYVIEPVYIYRPVIYDWFWGPTWVCWHSPYYWGYYPGWYVCYTPWIWHDYYYHMHAFHHHHPRCSFHYAHSVRHGVSGLRQSERSARLTRSDWAAAHPETRFSARAEARGVANATNARQLRTAVPQHTSRSTAAVADNRMTRSVTPAGTTGATRAHASASGNMQNTFGSVNVRSTRPTQASTSTAGSTMRSTASGNEGLTTRSTRSNTTAATTARPTATSTTRATNTMNSGVTSSSATTPSSRSRYVAAGTASSANTTRSTSSSASSGVTRSSSPSVSSGTVRTNSSSSSSMTRSSSSSSSSSMMRSSGSSSSSGMMRSSGASSGGGSVRSTRR